jgi:hypothetical protein
MRLRSESIKEYRYKEKVTSRIINQKDVKRTKTKLNFKKKNDVA